MFFLSEYRTLLAQYVNTTQTSIQGSVLKEAVRCLLMASLLFALPPSLQYTHGCSIKVAAGLTHYGYGTVLIGVAMGSSRTIENVPEQPYPDYPALTTQEESAGLKSAAHQNGPTEELRSTCYI